MKRKIIIKKFMKRVLIKLYNLLPFSLKLVIENNFYSDFNLDEASLVFEIVKSKDNGVMVDVGAHRGGALAKYLKRGWMIYAFEPNPENAKYLCERTKKHPNIYISNRAVSNESDKELPLYVSEVSSGISGLSKFHESHYFSQTVKTITLSDFLKGREISIVDFLKVDTEGFDLFVLEGFNWEEDDHPEIIICEFEDRKTVQLGYETEDLVSFLKEREYRVIISEWLPIEEYGSRHKWKRFIKNDETKLLDGDSWGNIIAFKKGSMYYDDFMKLIKWI